MPYILIHEYLYIYFIYVHISDPFNYLCNIWQVITRHYSEKLLAYSGLKYLKILKNIKKY